MRTVAWVCLTMACLLWGGCPAVFQGKFDEEKDPHYLTGKSRLNAMNYRGAIDAFQKALKVNPHSASAHFELGLIYYDKPRVGDPSAAIYHLRQFLNLQPDSPKRNIIEEYVLVCKRQLAQEVTLAPVTEKIQGELDKLIAENERLKQQVNEVHEANQKLRLALAQRSSHPHPSEAEAPFQQQPSPRTSPRSSRPVVSSTRSTLSTPTSTRPANRGMLKHRIAKNDTPYSIARRYNVSLNAFREANPGLQATKLRIGDLVNVPQR